MDSEVFNQLEANKPTILVIEDNTDDYFMIRWGLLQRFPDVELVCVSDATQVIPYLESCFKREMDLPRLILLDLYLPSAKVGLSVLQSLKSHQIYQQIPTIILSRSADPEDMGDVFKYSGNSYIVKPAKPKEWLDAFTLLQAYWK
jgi:CheY-like chemotaxis protein